ncbi:hypothetical protein [Actinokineospora diospyrosa]|uniref:Uncharacterized protein n=1 Tax=Actinokineospora diospyrosa TaxID=103728 RepID=A0ABT1I9I8_9PSEU|nr:hypothetical protein [Actinokineospora diospyrosa]MCP2269223.1 hypothetical protein [Actinokineospora diospyrosa]
MIRVELPQELADDLVAEELAIRPGPRGSIAQILIVGATSTATAISLLQAPDTFVKLAGLIKKRFGKQQGVTLTVKGNRGSVSLDVTNETDVETLAKLIKEGLVGDLD